MSTRVGSRIIGRNGVVVRAAIRTLKGLAYAFVLALLVPSCGGATSTVIGDEEVVETSRDEKPEWLKRPMCPEKKVCTTGSRTRSSTLEFARSDAQADAIKQFARMLESKAKTQFSSNRNERGLPEVGESPQVDLVLKELFSMASKINISNVKLEDFWWKKYRSIGEDGRYHYYLDYSVLVSIPEATWKRKVSEVINKTKAMAKEAKLTKLEEELDEFGKDLLEQ